MTEREHKLGGVAGRGRGSLAAGSLAEQREPDEGLHPRTLRSSPEPKAVT